MSNKKVLFISYRFAPEASTGSIRSNKFAKYLPHLGWDITVLTVSNPDHKYIDTCTLSDLTASVSIVRTPKLEPDRIINALNSRLPDKAKGISWRLKKLMNWVFFPDYSAVWQIGAIFKGIQLCRKHKFDVIYSSYAPAGTHIVALCLRKLFKTPWVTDFRDLWVHEWEYTPVSKLHRRLDTRIEKAVVSNASRVITTTAACHRTMVGAYPLDTDKFEVITNGYDPEDAPSNPLRTKPSHLVFTHTGALYSSRSIQHFIDAIDRIIDLEPEVADLIEIEQLGDVFNNTIASRHLSVSCLGWQPRETALDHIGKASVCLLPFHSADNGSEQLPLKMYEYLAFGNYILATGRKGCQADRLISDHDHCLFIQDGDSARLDQAILSIIDLHRSAGLYQQKKAANIERYSRKNLSRDLAIQLDLAIEER
ncbi:MAG: glycosyltransferase involved in cell wall biosynthesis [Motiliproteus sp.]|jgi:glycosyltransferase involved in cell wall biosynthesis